MTANMLKPKKRKVSEKTIDDLLDTASLILTTTSNILACAPIPHLPDAVSSLNDLITRVKSMRRNKKTRKDVADRIETLVGILQRIVARAESELKTAGVTISGDNPEVSLHVTERIKTLSSKLNDLNQEAAELGESSIICGIIRSDRDAETLEDLKEGLNDAIEDCKFEGHIYMGIVVEKIGRDVSTLRDVAINEKDMKTLESIPHAHDANYRSALNELKSGLLPGTRAGLLEEIEHWARAPLETNEPAIFVLTGAAGTGKSTIAFEVAKRLEYDGLLGASFFFIRGSEDLATTRLVFSTIAYQLAQNQPEFTPHIVEAARDYLRGGQQQQMEFTLKELIVEPLLKGFETHGPVVIIIDAVDECTEAAQDLVPKMLHLLAQYVPRMPFPLRVLVTSRPEYHVENALESLSFRNGSKRFKLQDILPTVAEGDIKQYLNARISDLPRSEEVFKYRDGIVDVLSTKAEGLFIYASTIIRLLRQDAEHTMEILDTLFTDSPIRRRLDLGELDSLYLLVLHDAFKAYLGSAIDDERTMRRVLASIALLQDQLSPTALHDLLELPVSDIRWTINRMGAVVFLDKDDSPIRPLHASFPQFLVDSRRCPSPEFYINPASHHIYFAIACLNILNKLRRNVCQLPNPATFKKDIEDLQTRVDRYLPSHFQYACIHWATHLSNVDTPSQELLEHLFEFSSKCLLFWFEALSYMGRLDSAPRALLNIHKWCQNGQLHDSDTSRLIHDGHRFVLEYFDLINECPGHIYISALPTTPSCRLVEVYSPVCADSTSVRILSPRDPYWGPSERVIEAAQDLVNGRNMSDLDYPPAVIIVTCSPNGRWIVAGMNDGSIKSWDAASGIISNVMTGHSGLVPLINVSPDNSRIISCAVINDPTGRKPPYTVYLNSLGDAKDLRIWNLATGALLYIFPLDPTIESFRAVSFSSDGDTIMAVVQSTSPPDRQVRMWDACTHDALEVNANCRRNLDRGIGGFPFQGNSFVTCVGNDIHCVLDYKSGYLHKTLQGQTGYKWKPHAAVFFPGQTSRVLSYNHTGIRIWDVESEQCLHFLEQAHLSCVAISRSGHTIASGSSDYRMVLLWNAETAKLIATLSGHANPPTSVSFAPDGFRLVSGDKGGTIHIWDLRRPMVVTNDRVHVVYSIWTPPEPVFSSSGKFVAMNHDGGSGQLLRIWSTADGALLHSIQRRERSSMTNIVFSPDDGRLAIDDDYGNLELFDVKTGKFVVHAGWKYRRQGRTACYSPDGSWFATVDDRNTFSFPLRVWRASDLRLEWTFHTGWRVSHLEFSPDSTRIYARDFTDSRYLWSCSTGQALPHSEMDWELKTSLAEPELDEKDGWLRDQSGQQICWLTESRRCRSKLSMRYFKGLVAIISSDDNLTILDISKYMSA